MSDPDPRLSATATPERNAAAQGVSSNTAAGSYGDSDTRNRTGGHQ